MSDDAKNGSAVAGAVRETLTDAQKQAAQAAQQAVAREAQIRMMQQQQRMAIGASLLSGILSGVYASSDMDEPADSLELVSTALLYADALIALSQKPADSTEA
jgi:hypothetical protein